MQAFCGAGREGGCSEGEAMAQALDPAWAEIEIIAYCRKRTDAKSVCPTEAAHALAISAGDGDEWRAHLPLARRTILALAREGRLILYRKGKAIHPDDLRGVYRIGLPRGD